MRLCLLNYFWQKRRWLLTCDYLWWALRSSQSGHVHSCSHLAARSHLRVWRLIVSIWIWLSLRRVAPLRVHCAPSPARIPFSLRRDRVWEELGALMSSRCCLTHCMTVGGSRVKLLSMTAAPARLSARSLPETPECPGLKTHVSFSRELSWRVLNQSAYKSSFFPF